LAIGHKLFAEENGFLNNGLKRNLMPSVKIFGNDTILTGFYSYGEIAPVLWQQKIAPFITRQWTITAFFRGLIMDKIHSLLKRQLKKNLWLSRKSPKDFLGIIGVINEGILQLRRRSAYARALHRNQLM